MKLALDPQLADAVEAVPARAKLAIDMRNHGRSPHAEGMSYEVLANDVAAALERAEIERSVLVGHSMGGKVAMQLAVTRPELVSALVVVDIAPVTYPPKKGDTLSVVHAMQKVDLQKCSSRANVGAALEIHGIASDAVRQFVMTNLVTRSEGGFDWRIGLDEIVREMPNIMGFPSHPGRYYNGRTCVIRGGKSQYVPFSAMRAYMSLFPATKLITLSDAGHWLQAEQPDAFCNAVNTFLEDED